MTVRKFLTVIITLIFFNHSYAQDNLPAYPIINGTLSTGNCWIVDSDSLRGNYPVNDRILVLTCTSGTRVNVFADSLLLRNDNDFLKIYDGNSTSATLIASWNRQTVVNSAVVSTGNVITIFFHVYNDVTVPNSHPGWRLGVRGGTPVATPVDFLPAYQGLGAIGETELADYDNDGDPDILQGGVVFQNDSFNDSAYIFNRIRQPIGEWLTSRMVSLDFDNDGFKDIFITGETNSTGIYKATAAIFKNNGGTGFTRVTSTTFPDATRGACALVDLNNDGKLDIVYTGAITTTVYTCRFKVYLNQGNMNFTELPVNIPGMMYSSMSWADYDNDGDPDLLMNGYNDVTGVTFGIYRNNGTGNFTFIQLTDSRQSNNGQVMWVDINADGKPDIINTGVYSQGGLDPFTPEIFINNGSGQFTRLATNLPNRARTNMDWYDYDNDGDPDMIMSGQLTSSAYTDIALYKNNRDGTFTRLLYNADRQALSTVKWLNINNDGKKDIFFAGNDNLNASFLLKYYGADSFRVCSYPLPGYQLGGAGYADVLTDDLNNDGLPDFLYAGKVEEQDCIEGNTSEYISSVAWRKTPMVILRKVADLNSIPGANVTSYSHWRWGDVTNDGYADILLTNGAEPLRVFRNDRNGNFSLLFTGMLNPLKKSDYVGVVDIDNDGSNELYAVPNRLYKWNGNGFTALYEQTGIGCEGFYIGDCSLRNYAFGDYNNDGYMDVAFTEDGRVHVLRNNRQGRFVNDHDGATAFEYGGSHEQVYWFDYDNDGDLDLILPTGLVENTAWGGFRVRGPAINAHQNLAIGDFNKDGWTDLFSNPEVYPFHTSETYYNMQGSAGFQLLNSVNPLTIWSQRKSDGIRAGDLDNDGDPDIVYGVLGDCTSSGIFVNRTNDFRRHINLQTPNGGEKYSIGTTQLLKWSGNGMGNTVKIEVSLNGGTNWTIVSASAATGPFNGEYAWNTNGLSVSSACRIRITDNTDNTLTDISDRNFSLTLTTGIGNVDPVNILKVFPNPGSGVFYCDTRNVPAGTRGRAEVIDLSGRKIIDQPFTTSSGGNLRLNISENPHGVYIIRLIYPASQAVEKVIKF